MSAPAVSTRPILAADVEAAAQFLHRELNPRVTAASWAVLLDPPWGAVGPHRGVQLVAADGTVVGVYAAVYAHRATPAGDVTVCNLAAFCVLEEHRSHSLRLMRALLGQKDVVFTDLSPSGNVVAMNERLGFRRLDTATRLVVNAPATARRGVVVTADQGVLAHTLVGADAQIFRDHRDAPAAHHVLATEGDRYAYLLYRRDRRKRLALFASPLYAGGDRALLTRTWRQVAAHLLRRGFLFTLAEERVIGPVPGLGRALAHPRAKMVRGDGLTDRDVDYLYSELTLVAW